MKKLSKPMEDVVKGATVHHVQVGGEVVRCGYIVAGNVNTIVALMDRGVCTASDAANHGLNWITDDGMKVWESLTGKSALLAIVECAAVRHYANATSDDAEIAYYLSPAYVASKRALLDAAVLAFPDLSEREFNDLFGESYSPGDLADIVDNFRADRDAMLSEDHPTESDMITDVPNTVVDYINTELDAAMIVADIMAVDEQIRQGAELDERLTSDDRGRFEIMEAADFDRMNADLERADIESEYMSEIIEEAYREGALMIMTRKNVIVSQSYMNTMRRIADVKRADHAKWAFMRDMVANAVDKDLFAELDADVAAGKMTFRNADQGKRIARKIIRPTLGSKHKPSKNRR
jgi:hypothetical protein